MPLVLQIVSNHKKLLGEDASLTVTTDGATIGRSQDNDWVLPDKNRYVSSRHATIDYQAGAYYLIDTSTNGVFVNGSDTPVGAGKPQRLFTGDKLAIGDYVVAAEVTEGEELSSIEELIESVVLDQVVDDVSDDDDSPSLLEESEITGSQSLEKSLFSITSSDTVATDDESDNVLSFDQGAAKARAATPQQPPPDPAADSGTSLSLRLEDSLIEAAQSSAIAASPAGVKRPPGRPAGKPAAGARAKPPQRDAGTTGGSGAAPGAHRLKGEAGAQLEFLRGLGITLAELGNPDVNTLMHNAGQALREFIVGMMDMLQTRASLKNTFRLEQTTIQASANNPLKFSASADDAIRNLLVGQKRPLAPSVETVREACRDVKVHEEALAAAMRTAFDEFIDRLEPEVLEDKFDNGQKRGSMFGGRKTKYWELYGELYHVMTQRSPGQFPHLFNEQFVRAYEEYQRAAKRKPRSGSAD
ncbi:MAG: type VI secretion system-associated FHA domain protein TagH [Pseudomonadota bacterium]